MFEKKRELPSVRSLRQSSGDLLASRENRLILIKSQILILIFVALYAVLSQVFSGLQIILTVDSAPSVLTHLLWGGYGLVLVAFSVLFMLPAIIGFLHMAGEMEQGKAVAPADLFCVFSEKSLYRWALRLSWRTFWRVGGSILTVRLTLMLSTYFFAGNLIVGLICGVVVLLELICAIRLILHGFGLLADTFGSSQTVCQARRSLSKDSARAGAHFLIGFLPWLLLGVLSYGILLLWEVFPCMAVSYFRYCRELKDQNLNIDSEE